MSEESLEESKIDMSKKVESHATVEKKMGKWTLRRTVEVIFGSAAAANLYHQQQVVNQIDSISVGIMKCLDVMDKFELQSKEAVQAQIVMGNLLKNLPDARKEIDVWKIKMLLINKEAVEDAKARRKELNADFKKHKKPVS